MELFESVRLKIGNHILKKNYSRINRKMFYSNISSIRSLGIIWDPENADIFPSQLSQFINLLHERKIESRIIGYFPVKIIPAAFAAVKHLTVIRRDELDSFYVPVSKKAVEFMNRKLDVLIDLNFNKVFPLYYISLLSKAKFKVGLAGPKSESMHYDLMMDVKPPVEISDYLKNVLYYLEMINSASENQN